MKSFFKSLAALLRQTWAWSLLLVLVLAAFVWWVGPSLAVNDWRFWAGLEARLITFCGLLLTWGLLVAFASWDSARRKQKTATDKDVQKNQTRKNLLFQRENALSKAFKKALTTLETTSLYGRRSKRSRRDLPWYLLLGPEGSGKSSLLRNSGLEFPLNTTDETTLREAKEAGCNWYFAEQGIVLESESRWLEQADAQADAPGWRQMLRLLRERRRSRPLSGVLVNLPVAMLIDGNAELRERLAGQVHARLQDLHRRLRCDVPVYLVLSKADEIPGFDGFFDGLAREENQQVLGASFTTSQAGNDPQLVREELKTLLAHLDSQMMFRTQQERSTQRRAHVLEFPQQLGRLEAPLSAFVEKAFASNRYQHNTTLRGFYLSSAAHSEKPPEEKDASVAATAIYHPARFMNHLFSQVIFPEAGLAGVNRRETQRQRWRQRALYAAAFTGLAVGALAWTGGFSANYDRLEDLRTKGRLLVQDHTQLRPQDDAQAALNILDQSYAATQVFPARSDLRFYENNGLYQGHKSNPALEASYLRELDVQLLPRITAALGTQVSANLGNREQLLGALRAYLMLNLPNRRDNAQLTDAITADWAQRYPTDVQQGLNTHLQRLLAKEFVASLNDPLVAQARQTLRGESLATVVYRVLREQAQDLPSYSLGQNLGPQGGVFSGTGYVIPGLYTQKGYQQFFLAKGTLLVDEILQDNWVLGEGKSLSPMDLRRLLVELEQLYFRDYANYWGEAVNLVSLEPIENASQGAEQAAALTAANSPLVQMLQEVRDNTRFTSLADKLEAAPDVAPIPGVLGKVAAVAVDQAKSALPKALPDTARKALQQRFDPLHRLLDDNNAATADFAAALQSMNGLQQQLMGLARSGQPDQAAYDLARQRMGNQRDGMGNLRVAAMRLPQPVGGWLSGQAEDAWRVVLDGAYGFINQRYKAELYGTYVESINQRFPFYAHSTSDVALADFREFFKAHGAIDKFFSTYLQPFVAGDTSNYRVRTVDGRGLPMSLALLGQMRNVQTIRRSFFAENPDEPLINFKLEPVTLDSSVMRVQFMLGDQQLTYRHGPVVPMAFKWPSEAKDGRASLVVDEHGGRSTGIQKDSGPWSLFRLFDLMQTEYQSGRDVLMLKANVGGQRANFLLLSQRSPSPFDLTDLRRFRLPVSL